MTQNTNQLLFKVSLPGWGGQGGIFKEDIWVPKTHQHMTQEHHKCQTQVKDPLVISASPGPCQRLLTIVMGQDIAKATITPFPALGVIRTQALQGSTPAAEIMALLLSK